MEKLERQLSRHAFAVFSDEQVFQEVKLSAANRIEEISTSFLKDANIVGVENKLKALTIATTEALKDLPFPRELSLGREAARRKAVNIGAGALSEFLSGGDPRFCN